jgi:hypothetical protein
VPTDCHEIHVAAMPCQTGRFIQILAKQNCTDDSTQTALVKDQLGKGGDMQRRCGVHHNPKQSFQYGNLTRTGHVSLRRWRVYTTGRLRLLLRLCRNQLYNKSMWIFSSGTLLIPAWPLDLSPQNITGDHSSITSAIIFKCPNAAG